MERQIALGASREDLDDQLVLQTVRLAVESRRWQGSPQDVDGFLHALGLVVQDAETNAALVLYGRNPTQVLPQARVRLLVMPEGKTGSKYSIDRLSTYMSASGCAPDFRIADELAGRGRKSLFDRRLSA
jgi:predicted HTH transcriptional regulator